MRRLAGTLPVIYASRRADLPVRLEVSPTVEGGVRTARLSVGREGVTLGPEDGVALADALRRHFSEAKP